MPVDDRDVELLPGERCVERARRGQERRRRRAQLRNPRRVVSRELALDRAWGSATAASLNVVDRYVSYLRRKLGEPELIWTVRGVGFILER